MSEGLRRVLSTFFDPGMIAQAMPEILRVGLPNTLLLSFFASAIGIALGMLIAGGLLSGYRSVTVPCRAYVDVLRGLPHILTVYLIGQGLPLAGLAIFGGNTYGYAALAIGLIESAYFAEIFRAGFQSVERGQVEAARSTGMTRLQTMRHIVIPQGARRVLPPLTGQFILVVKATSLVYLLGLTASQREMFAIAQDSAINNANLSPLTAAGLVYLALTIPTTYAVNAWDRRIRGANSARPAEAD